ncbi:hypothetical protein ES707_10066 [subsurface metagenome]
MHIFADPNTCGVVNVIVEQRPDISNKIRVIGNLHYHIKINPGLLMVMPYYNGVNFMHSFEVNCNVLHKRA